jgi:hypothetical protein
VSVLFAFEISMRVVYSLVRLFGIALFISAISWQLDTFSTLTARVAAGGQPEAAAQSSAETGRCCASDCAPPNAGCPN